MVILARAWEVHPPPPKARWWGSNCWSRVASESAGSSTPPWWWWCWLPLASSEEKQLGAVGKTYIWIWFLWERKQGHLPAAALFTPHPLGVRVLGSWVETGAQIFSVLNVCGTAEQQLQQAMPRAQATKQRSGASAQCLPWAPALCCCSTVALGTNSPCHCLRGQCF